jgi:hypothetical protein
MITVHYVSRRILTGLAVILTITALILIGLNALNLKKHFQWKSSGYVEGYNAAREKYAKMCPMINDPITLFSGTISHRSGKILTIISDHFDSGFSSNFDEERKVIVSDQTKISKRVERDSAEYDRLLKTFDPRSTELPPMPFTFTDLELSDLNEGMNVTIQTNEDARTTAELTAINITLP